MKQIEECLDRAFNHQKPLRKKWKAIIEPESNGQAWIGCCSSLFRKNNTKWVMHIGKQGTRKI